LTSLCVQLRPGRAEILVAYGSKDKAACPPQQEFPSVRFLKQPAGTSVPKLWSAGIAAAQGSIVALTIEQCVPEPDWAEQLLRAHGAEWPAIGGAMDIDPGVRLTDWAVYFCRYSRYIPPFSRQFLNDLPGDNCSYKRAALEGLERQMSEGFWETFVHQAMRARGQQLFSDPGIVVRYCGPFPFWGFLRRRFADARYFSSRRAREVSSLTRISRALGSLAVPGVLLARIGRRVWRNGRYRAKFLAALPLLLGFLVAWASGEGLGYLFGPSEKSVASAKESAAWYHSA
jgi:hypothetical protein